ncbi:MAG: hypothetical protein ACM3L8_03485 [Verrucomicrobiota bacterium]
MQNYIVRIYRRTEENGGLFGVVEEVGVDGQIAFHSMAELLRLLRGDPRDAGEGPGPGQSGAPGETQGRIP